MDECDWEDIVWEIAWEHFKTKLYKMVLKKLGKRAALALLAALADSPVPGPGDILAVLILLLSVLDGAWNTTALIRELLNLNDSWRAIIRREMREMGEIFGDRFLDDDCACECLKTYIRDIISSSRAMGKSRRRRLRRQARQNFNKCIKDCF